MYQIKRYSEEDELPQVPFKLALFLGCVFAGSTNGLLVASIKARASRANRTERCHRLITVTNSLFLAFRWSS